MNDFFVWLLTSIIGGIVATFFAVKLERIKWRNQLTLAALEKRLEVYQRAFTLWSDLVANIYDRNKIYDEVRKCQVWWYKNCLYLDKDSRELFRDAYIEASRTDFEQLTKNTKLIQEYFNKIYAVKKAIERAMDLPVIADVENELKEIGKRKATPDGLSQGKEEKSHGNFS